MPIRISHVVTASTLLVSLATIAHGQCITRNIPGTLLAGGDQYGKSVSVSAGAFVHFAAIGAPGDEHALINAGSVRVQRLDSNLWTETARVTAPVTQTNAEFGRAVAIDYPYMLVGAPGQSDGGAAYAFEHLDNQWQWRGTMAPFATDPGDRVGQAVAMDGGWGIVGCPHADQPDADGVEHTDCGVVHFVRRNANGIWVSAGTYLVPQNFGYLGWSVAMSCSHAAAGRPFGSMANGPTASGGINLYRFNGENWINQPSIVDPAWSANDNVGYSVTIGSDALAAGAPGDDASAGELPSGASSKLNCGSVLIYDWNDAEDRYSFAQRLFASDPTDNARFGSSVSMSGDLLIVGAEGSRTAYLFRKRPANQGGLWVEVARYTDPHNNGASALFANAVSIRGSVMVVTDPGHDTGGDNSGNATNFHALSAAAAADLCASATPMGTGTYPGCTALGSSDGMTACGNGGAGQGPDSWYSYTPQCSGPVTVQALADSGSALDPVLSIHTDCPTIDGYHLVGCNDNTSGLGSGSRLTFTAQAGTRYLIRVAGFNQTRGSFTVTLSASTAAPSNDTCAQATFVSPGVTYFRNCNASVNFLPEPLCGVSSLAMTADVWFRYTAPADGRLVADTCNSTFDTTLVAYRGANCPTSATPAIACNDDLGAACTNPFASSVSLAVAAGDTIFLRVAGSNASGAAAAIGDGVLNLSLFPSCPCDYSGDNDTTVQDIFNFLFEFFNATSAADFNNSGTVTVQDIFDFLSCWFQGC